MEEFSEEPSFWNRADAVVTEIRSSLGLEGPERGGIGQDGIRRQV